MRDASRTLNARVNDETGVMLSIIQSHLYSMGADNTVNATVEELIHSYFNNMINEARTLHMRLNTYCVPSLNNEATPCNGFNGSNAWGECNKCGFTLEDHPCN